MHETQAVGSRIPTPAELAAQLKLAFIRRQLHYAPRNWTPGTRLCWTSESDSYGGERRA